MTYFSEKEEGELPRVHAEIGSGAWGGIQALVRRRINDASFGATYPDYCQDGNGIVGTDINTFWTAMQGDIPKFQMLELPVWQSENEMPRTMDILDMIEFCWHSIGMPTPNSFHNFFDHEHFVFDIKSGQENFRKDINRIFRRNAIAIELLEDGSIERLVPPVLSDELVSAHFQTPDAELNRMLETARRKFLDPDVTVRREALETLWDAWERLKTMGSGSGKKAQITALLDTTAGPSSPVLRDVLEKEAKQLTFIGNDMQIRHSEKDKEQVAMSEHIDYLFHRLFSLILVIVRMNRGGFSE